MEFLQCNAPAPVVDTEAGKVQGYCTDEGISVYKGIPYVWLTLLPLNDGFRTSSPCSPGKG